MLRWLRRLTRRSTGAPAGAEEPEDQSVLSVELQGLAPDKPETDPARDQLGYDSFARHLASSILRMAPNEGLVIGVYGAWGLGKTTLVSFVLKHLGEADEARRPVVMEFNPWWFSGTEDLTRRFFDQLLEELGERPVVPSELREAVAELGNIVSKVPVGWLKVAGEATKLVRPKRGDIVKAKARVAEILAKQPRKLLIVLDDIDRLTADEIREMFRLVKSVGDFPNVIYLLAFDREVVSGALKRLQDMSGEEYLEKIVQVPFELPLPDRADLRRMLTSKLDQLLGDQPSGAFDPPRWRDLYLEGIDHFITTPRDVVRLTNTLSVTYPAVRGEVNLVDFIGIEALRVFLPAPYNVIRRNPDYFAGQEGRGLFRLSEESLRPFHDAWLAQVREEDRGAARALVTQLFPKVAVVWGGTGHVGDWETGWRRELRACSPDVFPVYFRFAVPTTGVSASEMRAILALASDSAAFGARFVELAQEKLPTGQSRARGYLDRLSDHAEEDIPVEAIPTVLRGLYDVGDALLLPEDEPAGLFAISNEILISRIAMRLLRRLGEPERYQILSGLASEAHALGMLVFEVDLLGRQHSKYGASASTPEADRHVTVDHLAALEQITLQRIRQTTKRDPLALLEHRLLAGLIYRWRDWGSETEVRRWIAHVLPSDTALVRLLEEFLMHGWASKQGRTYTLNTQGLGEFFDPVSIVERVRTLAMRQDLSDHQRIAIQTFLEQFGAQ